MECYVVFHKIEMIKCSSLGVLRMLSISEILRLCLTTSVLYLQARPAMICGGLLGFLGSANSGIRITSLSLSSRWRSVSIGEILWNFSLLNNSSGHSFLRIFQLPTLFSSVMISPRLSTVSHFQVVIQYVDPVNVSDRIIFLQFCCNLSSFHVIKTKPF